MRTDKVMRDEIQRNGFETLSRLISFKPENYNNLLILILEELLIKTNSQKGYAFSLDNIKQSFSLLAMVDLRATSVFDNKEVKTWEQSKAGLWIKVRDDRNLVVINNKTDFFPLNNDANIFEVVRRFCSFPITISNSLNTVLVVTDKSSDYDIDDIQYLESLIRPISSIAENWTFIEDLRIAKKRSEKNEEQKSSYLTNIAHAIKSPVNAISGFSSLLKEKNLSIENRQKFLDIILESSRDLVSIINSVVEISNFESGILYIVEKEVDLNDLIKEVYEIFSEAASGKNLLLKTEVTIPESDLLILADKERLKQILSCLVSNSLRFTFSGKIVLGCSLKDGFIEFFVSDTGTGISEENQKLVFDHFFQAGDSLSGSYKGVGLGLTIAKGYVERMGGTMKLVSSEGKGSDFFFTIPLKKPHSAKISEIKHDKGQTKPHNKRRTILVAEDDNLNFSLIKNFLSKLDVDLLRAENGKVAVDLCNVNQFDLILMDIRMPEMDGYTATRLIKENNPEQIIIAQTAYTNDRQTALANGCDDFIAKPFGRDQLLNLVKSYL